MLGRAEVVLLLREHLFELGLSRFAPLGDPTRFLGDVAGYISRAKEEGVGADQIDTFATDLCARAETLESSRKSLLKTKSRARITSLEKFTTMLQASRMDSCILTIRRVCKNVLRVVGMRH